MESIEKNEMLALKGGLHELTHAPDDDPNWTEVEDGFVSPERHLRRLSEDPHKQLLEDIGKPM
ncbi:MAG: hypothetical protein ACWA6U_12485 [Breznakibacter sp.]